jgi:hypothetical protein
MNSVIKKLIGVAIGILAEYITKYGKVALDYIFDQIEKFILKADMDDDTKDTLIRMCIIIRDVVSVPDDDSDQLNPV